MALTTLHKDVQFGVGDVVRVVQNIKEGDKSRQAVFEGMVIGIKGRDENKSFMVRRIGSGQIGIERIFPLLSPTIEKVDVVRRGTKGVRHAKLRYIRGKSRKEIEKIYARNARREEVEKKPVKKSSKSKKKSS